MFAFNVALAAAWLRDRDGRGSGASPFVRRRPHLQEGGGVRTAARWLVAAALTIVGTGPAQADGWMSDAWITAKAKIALATARDLTASEVAVDTIDGR